MSIISLCMFFIFRWMRSFLTDHEASFFSFKKKKSKCIILLGVNVRELGVGLGDSVFVCVCVWGGGGDGMCMCGINALMKSLKNCDNALLSLN